jgi:hypothetical protein
MNRLVYDMTKFDVIFFDHFFTQGTLASKKYQNCIDRDSEKSCTNLKIDYKNSFFFLQNTTDIKKITLFRSYVNIVVKIYHEIPYYINKPFCLNKIFRMVLKIRYFIRNFGSWSIIIRPFHVKITLI